MNEIEPRELMRQLEAGTEWTIVDVREPHELAVASLPDARHIPMAEIPARLDELPALGRVAVLCHSGGRSARVTLFLESQGFANAANIVGGIDRWAVEVDTSLPRY
ncbi:MAG: rhodanese-like domain-containing protein [Pseudomonadota bacterium]